MRWLAALIGIGLVGAVIFWFLSAPQPIAASAIPDDAGDSAAGRIMFFAGGCASCHKTPDQDDPLNLGGGFALKSPFGTFYAPNISSDPNAGIGGWSKADFFNAMKRGIGPDGSHLYPAFPYTSYQRMTNKDVGDLWAFLRTVPAVATASRAHDIGFPFNIRRGLGLWKLLYLDGKPFEPNPKATDVVNRGSYLVNGPSHCSECHTPRNVIGGPIRSRFLAGGPNPEGEGKVPNITPSPDGVGSWSADDIAYALDSGFTPDFDSLGGSMAAVVRNMHEIPASDREAIAAYLKSVPPLPNEN